MVNCYSYTGVHNSAPSILGCTDNALSLHHKQSSCCSSICCCTVDPRNQSDMCICLSLGHICPFGMCMGSHSSVPNDYGCRYTRQSSHHTGHWGNNYTCPCSQDPRTGQDTLLKENTAIRTHAKILLTCQIFLNTAMVTVTSSGKTVL